MKAKKRDNKEEATISKSSSAKLSFLKKGLLATILVIFALALSSGVASATTHVVNQTDPACTAGDAYYTTIQAAINAANPGDTIIVCPGTYQETVDVNKSDIVIKAHDGTKPVVSALNIPNNHVFNITDQMNVTLQGFEIRDARGTNQSVAGIYMHNASECNITNTVIANISNVNATRNAYGVYLHSSNNNTFDPTEISNVNASYTAFGLYLEYSNNNSFTVTEVSDVTASYVPAGVTYGIYIYNSDDNRFSSTNVSNINATHYNDAYGILLESSNNNSFSSSTNVSYITATNAAFGIWLYVSNNNSFSSSTNVSYINATNYAYGILLWESDNNSFSSSTNVSYILLQPTTPSASCWSLQTTTRSVQAPPFLTLMQPTGTPTASICILQPTTRSALAAYQTSMLQPGGTFIQVQTHRNSAENITISSFPTTISFTYDNGVGIKSVETPPPDPALKSNIGKYVDATNVTANSWLFLNVSYNASDVSGVQEDSLKMWKYNGTWQEVEGVTGVNTAENYVYANITEFSVFAPLGNSTRITIPAATGSGDVVIETDKGYFCNETDALPASPPDPPALTFPHGFFNVTICGLNDTSAETVTINFTFPSAIPTNAEFWKYNSSNGTWYQYQFNDNDGDNFISITITDNGAGDHDPALGVINDPNGIGWTTVAVPELTPIGLIALVGLLSVVLAVSISIRRKK